MVYNYFSSSSNSSHHPSILFIRIVKKVCFHQSSGILQNSNFGRTQIHGALFTPALNGVRALFETGGIRAGVNGAGVKKGPALKGPIRYTYTVKPLYSGHLRDRSIVSAIESCPLYKGSVRNPKNVITMAFF